MRVALTGATGFIGTRLVRELLSRHEAITILTRAGGADPVDRIARALHAVGTPEARLTERLRVVEIELSRPDLGLSASAFREPADGLDAVWHCAGDIDLEASLAKVRAVDVEGTRNVLALAAAGRRNPLFCHISTAFVAAARRTGVVYEDDLDGSWGFENAYEQSKYEAELLVHSWAIAHRRPAVVLRPGTLVDDAAAAIVEPAQARRDRGVDTYHVVHHRDVTMADVQHALRDPSRTRFTLVQEDPVRMTELEAKLREHMPSLTSGFLPYLAHRRRYDDTNVRKVLGTSAGTTPIGAGYLLSGLRDNSRLAEITR